MASNPTPDRFDALLSAGEDFYDGLGQHAAAIGIKQNTAVIYRADLDALIVAKNAQAAAEGTKPAAATALAVADSNGKGFIARAIKVLSISLGNDWSDAWLATGLPDNRVGQPPTQNGRFAVLGGLKAYFTANAGQENAALNVTAAIAQSLYTAVSDARAGVANAQTNVSTKTMAKDVAKQEFRVRYRGGISELEQLMEDDDPKWYDFGLSRPSDPMTPRAPSDVTATALGGGRVLVQTSGARRANSFNYYRKIVGTDAEPVKVTNTEGDQFTMEGFTAGKSVEVTATGVNDAGEGPASDPVTVVVT